MLMRGAKKSRQPGWSLSAWDVNKSCLFRISHLTLTRDVNLPPGLGAYPLSRHGRDPQQGRLSSVMLPQESMQQLSHNVAPMVKCHPLDSPYQAQQRKQQPISDSSSQLLVVNTRRVVTPLRMHLASSVHTYLPTRFWLHLPNHVISSFPCVFFVVICLPVPRHLGVFFVRATY